MSADSRQMVRAELLRPGDVILLRSRGWISTLIALAGSRGPAPSRYSHAALVTRGRTWFESNDSGVGYLYHRYAKVEQRGSELWWLIDVSEYQDLAIYRHPALHATDFEQDASFEQLIHDTVIKWRGREYPPLRRLSGASPLFSSVPYIKRLGGDIVDRLDQLRFNLSGTVAPGPFCSELVVRVYAKLAETRPELAIMKSPRGARFTSPSDLADPTISELEQRPEIVVREDRTLPDWREANFVMEDSYEKRIPAWQSFQAQLRDTVRDGAKHDRYLRKMRKTARALEQLAERLKDEQQHK